MCKIFFKEFKCHFAGLKKFDRNCSSLKNYLFFFERSRRHKRHNNAVFLGNALQETEKHPIQLTTTASGLLLYSVSPYILFL